MENGSKDRYFQADAKKLVPEGVEGRVAYKGSIEDTVFQLMGGLRSGMGYCGAKDVETLKETGKFVKISAASLKESHPHDIHMLSENDFTDDLKDKLINLSNYDKIKKESLILRFFFYYKNTIKEIGQWKIIIRRI